MRKIEVSSPGRAIIQQCPQTMDLNDREYDQTMVVTCWNERIKNLQAKSGGITLTISLHFPSLTNKLHQERDKKKYIGVM